MANPMHPAVNIIANPRGIPQWLSPKRLRGELDGKYIRGELNGKYKLAHGYKKYKAAVTPSVQRIMRGCFLFSRGKCCVISSLRAKLTMVNPIHPPIRKSAGIEINAGKWG